MPPIPPRLQSGIYRIHNKVNGKFYIGSTIESFKQRWSKHRYHLRKQIHCNRHLQRAWNKYGEDAFEFKVVERRLPEQCLEREQHYLDTERPWDRKIGYNLSKGVGSGMIGLKHTEETKAKQRAKKLGGKHTEEHKLKIGISSKENHWSKREDAAEIAEKSASKNRGKKRSEETVENIREGHWTKGEKAEETGAKIAASNKARTGWKMGEQQLANIAEGKRKAREERKKDHERLAKLIVPLAPEKVF